MFPARKAVQKERREEESSAKWKQVKRIHVIICKGRGNAAATGAATGAGAVAVAVDAMCSHKHRRRGRGREGGVAATAGCNCRSMFAGAGRQQHFSNSITKQLRRVQRATSQRKSQAAHSGSCSCCCK